MITGFNTDIEFEGVTYHVQTEDKGSSRPVIMSLIYDRGTILASKRSPYNDLLGNNFDESVLAERLQKQHKTICAAIKAGRIEDLKKMSARDGGSKKPVLSEVAKPAEVPKKKERKKADVQSLPEIETADDPVMDASIPKPDQTALPVQEESEVPEVQVVSVIEEAVLVAETAVAFASDLAGKERPTNNRLAIEFLVNEKFKAGETKTLTMMVRRGSEGKVIAGAEVMVKVIGSAFRPLIYHSSTDKNGLAQVTLQFPKFKSGRAAFLIRAMSDGEEVELRRPILHA